MTFQLVYYSQQDSKWKQDILGFGDPGDTIGYVGCALASVAMLISGYGFIETPKTLNQKLKNVNGFVSAGIRWGAVSQVYPQIVLKSNISCLNTDAPLAQIDASIAAGQPVIVMVDSTPVAGLLTHWVVLYAKEGNDYLMLDPWPYQPDPTKKTYMMPRYSQGASLKRAIMHVIIYESFNASGGISQPASSSTPANQPASVPALSSGPSARVKVDVTWGLNIRSSIDTSSPNNIVAVVSAGSLLTVVGAEDYAKIGGVNQWVRVRDNSGHEGFAAAWYLEKLEVAPPAPIIDSTPKPAVSAPVSPPVVAPEKEKMIVIVKSSGATIYKTASKKGEVLIKEKAKARLVVVEAASKAESKIGIAGKWLNVKSTNGKRGFVDGGLVKKI